MKFRAILLSAILLCCSFQALGETRDLEHFLRVGRMDFYLQQLAERLESSGDKLLAERLRAITPEQISQRNPPSRAQDFDSFIQKELTRQGVSASEASRVAWNYPFLKSKLNEAFVAVTPGSPKSPKAPSVPPLPLRDAVQALELHKLDGSPLTFDAEQYIESRTTRAIFWDMAENGTQLELHLGSMRDFRERLDRRGGSILKEVRPWSRNYNKIYLVQYPGEPPRYAITGVSGYDRMEHLARSLELVSWNGKKPDWEKNVRLYGDLTDKLKRDAAELTTQFANLPKADRVIIGQKAQVEKAFQAAAKAEALLKLDELAPGELRATLTPEQNKLLSVMRSNLNPFLALEKAPEWERMKEAAEPLLSAKGVTIANPRDLAVSNPSHDLADYVFKARDGKTVRWRLIENVWGDEILPIAQAIKASGASKVAYIGTAGALPGNEALKVGDLFVPSEARSRLSPEPLPIARPRAPPAMARIGGSIENVATPFEETELWLKKALVRSKAVELEVGYLASVFPDLEPYLLISDEVGSREKTLDKLNPRKLQKARTAVISSLFEADGALSTAPAPSASSASPLEAISRRFPKADAAWQYRLLQLAREQGTDPIVAEKLEALASKSPSFTSKLLTDRLVESGTILASFSDHAAAQGIELKPYVASSVARGTFHPRQDTLEMLLEVPDPTESALVEQWLKQWKEKNPKLAKRYSLQVARGPPTAQEWIAVEGQLDGRLSRHAVQDLYARAAYANAGMLSPLGKDGVLTLQSVPTSGNLKPCTPKAVSCHLQYYAPDAETRALLAKFNDDDALGSLRRQIALQIRGSEIDSPLDKFAIRIDEVAKLPDGALAEIIPELSPDGDLIIVMRFTPEGAKNSMVVKEETLHLRQILGKTYELSPLGEFYKTGVLNHGTAFGQRLGSPWGWLEWVLNSRAGSVPAKYQLALLEKEAAERLQHGVSNAPFPRPDEVAYAQKRLSHAEARLREVLPEYRAWKKKEKEATAAQKLLQKELDAQKDKIDAMIARNDRKGVAALLRKYLPWAQMEPSENVAWSQWLDAIENPSTNPADKIVLYSGLKGDLIKESADRKSSYIFSKILEKGQGNYNFRLRRLESMNEKLGRGPQVQDGSTSLISALFHHAVEPLGSPFRSLTPQLWTAKAFGPPIGVFYMDKRRALPNAAGIIREREYLTAITTFPDELVLLERSSVSDEELFRKVEQKLGFKPEGAPSPDQFSELARKRTLELWSRSSKPSLSRCVEEFAKVVQKP